MKKILYGFLALASVAMVSCSQEYDEQITANTDQVKKVFTASTEENSTRTSIAVEQETGNYVVIWNGEELIAVNGVDYKVIDGAGTKNVKFGANVDGVEAATTEVYNAVYPNNAWVEGGLNLEHLKEQTAANSTFGHGYAVTVSTTTKNSMDFKFKNALSFLRVRFTLAEDAKEDAITIKTVKITADDYLWGTVSDVNYSTGVIGTVTNDSEAGKTIVYTAGEDVVLTKENMYEAVIAVPVNEAGRTLTIEIEGENAWTGNRYTYTAEGVTKKYLRNNVTTLAKAIKPIEVIYVAEGVVKTKEDTFEITGLKGLEWVRNQVESGENVFKGQTLVMTEDVDLASIADWTPLSYENYFEGTFDGNNKTISNLTIAQEDNYYLGFFGVAKNATFKNIVFHNASVYNTNGVLANASGGHFAILCGYTAGTTTIDNVTVTGNVKLQGETAHAGGQRIGTMIGLSNGVANITNVTINAEEGSFVNGYSFVGGVVGQGLSKVVAENVHSNLDVQGVQFAAGGLAGCAEKGSTFTNCSVSGNVTLVGARPLATTVNDVVRIGGIVGTYSGDDKQSVIVTLTGCTHTGTLSSKTTADEVATAFDFRGLVGRAYNAGAGTVGSKIVIDGVEFTDCGSGVYLVDGAYEVGSVAALKWIANEVNVNKNSFAGKTVKLVGDIDLSSIANWTPIGTGSAAPHFQGTFDGQNYTISGLTIKARTNDAPQAALFGSVAGTVTIKDLTIDGANIVYPKDGADFYGAALVGTYYGTVTVQNVTVQNSYISGNNKVAGLLAHDGSSSKLLIEDCKVLDSTIESTDTADGGNVGGVIGLFQQSTSGVENIIRNVTVKGCTINGINSSDSGKRANGLIVGSVIMKKADTTLKLENCTVEDNTFVSGNTNYVSAYGSSNLVGGFREGSGYYMGMVYIDGVLCEEQIAVAVVDGKNYFTLAEAVAAANGKTVKLLENVTLEEGIVIANGTEVTLDLNGKTISQEKACTASYTMISNNGTLTIDDSSSEKNGMIIFTDLGNGDASFGWGSYTIRNNGTLTINAGTIKNATRAMSHCTVPLMLYAGKTTINGGAIVSANYRSIQGFATPEVIINGGAFEGQVWMHETCSATASLTINGGTFEPRGNDGSSVFLNNTKDIKLAITGGYFKTKVGCDDKTKAGVVGAVKGGFFTEAAKTGGATAALVAEGYSWVESGDATYPWTLTEQVPVASVDGTEYTTLAEAVAAANGKTVKLVGDIVLEESLAVAAGNNVTIDLNGKTISGTYDQESVYALVKNNGNLTLTGNGTISFETDKYSAANSYASNTITNYGNLVVGGEVKIANTSKGGACYAIDNYAGAICTIKENAYVSAYKTAVRIFNWDANTNTTINVEGGTIYTEDGYGINTNTGDAPNFTLNISGGTITTNDTDYNLAVYMVAKGTVNGSNLKFNVTGGTFNGNFALNGNTCTLLKEGNVEISGGDFKNGIIAYGTPAVPFVKGGVFAEDPSDYVMNGYVATFENNVYTVAEAVPVATVNGVKYADMVEAFKDVENGGTITLVADAEVAQDETVALKNKSFTLDLAGKTLSSNNTRTATHNALFDVNSGAVMTVKNGTIEYTHTGSNMGWNGAATVINVTAGGVLNLEGVKVINNGGTDMNFAVHLNNWGEVTVNANNCVFEAPYCGFRVFNSGFDMNNVTITNSTLKGNNRAFWVHNYIGDLDKSKHSDEAVKARLNLDIFGNGNTFVLASEAISPIRFGFNSAVYFDPETGNEIIANKAQLIAFAEAVNSGANNYEGKTVLLGADIDLGGAAWTPIGNVSAAEYKNKDLTFLGTFDGQNHTISNFTIAQGNAAAVGFFGVKYDGDIKNVKFDNVTVTGNHYGAVVVGWTDGAQRNNVWNISNCHVTNSTVTLAVENNDNGDKAGAIVGYAYAVNVTDCSVADTTIKGYRDLGGIAGIAQENSRDITTVKNNIVGSNVKIEVDNTVNYKNYNVQADYNVADYVGRISSRSVVSNNTGLATINWNGILAFVPVATVDGTPYATIADALAVAGTNKVITLLADATVSQACQIKKNGYNLDINGEFYVSVDGDVTTIEEAIKMTLIPNTTWKNNSDRYTAYVWNEADKNGVTPTWYDVVDNVVLIPASKNYDDVIFVAMKKGNATNDWTAKQYQTQNMKIKDGDVCGIVANTEVSAGIWKSDYSSNNVYLLTNNNWATSGARYAAYTWGKAEDWDSLTSYNNSSLFYVAKSSFTSGNNKVILCRMNPNATANNWSNKWNQTADLSIPTSTQNIYVMNAGSWDAGAWNSIAF